MQISVRTFLTDANGKTTENIIVFGRSGYLVRWIAAPGAMILITPPDGSLATVLQKRMTIPEAGELKHHLTNPVHRISNLSQVAITIDSVIFADGEVIGPDRLGALVIVNAMNAADASIASEVLARNGDDIPQYLKSIAEPLELQTRSAAPSRDNMSEDQLQKVIYDERLWQFAQGLLHTQDFLKSDEAFTRHVRSIAENPYPTAWRRP